MSEIKLSPMKIDQEDRPMTSTPTNNKSMKNDDVSCGFLSSLDSTKKKILFSLAILIILLFASFFIFNSSSETKTPINDDGYTVVDPNAIQSKSNTTLTSYTSIEPISIYPQATEAKVIEDDKERLEVAAEIIDEIEKKIVDINKPILLETNDTRIRLNSKETELNTTYNESVLTNQLPNDHYTIQLSASSSLENLLAMVKKHQITNYQIYESRRDNKIWFILIKGNYPSAANARAAIESIPEEFKKNKPWIKSGETINKEKQ